MLISRLRVRRRDRKDRFLDTALAFLLFVAVRSDALLLVDVVVVVGVSDVIFICRERLVPEGRSIAMLDLLSAVDEVMIK